LAVAGLVAKLRERFPEHHVLVSTTTATGQKLARDRFGEQNVFYFPLDFGFCVQPYLRGLRPELVVMAETELWPNFLRLSRAGGAKIAVVNARISDRSLPGYLRFRRWLRPVLENISLFLTQTDEDARRLAQIGAVSERVRASGNLKFDVPPPGETALVAQLRDALSEAQAGPVLVCGSTMEGEEPLLLVRLGHAKAPSPTPRRGVALVSTYRTS
jgi:3-deoxy-D-manno-octulosonic-acid transferase